MPTPFPLDGAGAAIGNGLLGRQLKSAVVSGAAANTNIAVAGIDPKQDQIIAVIETRNGLKQTLVAGASAGNLTVTGIATEDRIISVIARLTASGSSNDGSDLTAEFSITAANTINNTGGTSTASNQVSVLWEDISTSHIDRTSIASISSRGNIQLTSTTVGSKLIVIYADRSVIG